MCFGSTLSYPHKRIFKPAPAPSTSRTRPAASSTRLAQDYNLYTSLAHSQDFLNLLESEHLVCSATAATKTELGIIQLWFNYFAASHSCFEHPLPPIRSSAHCFTGHLET